MNSPDQLVFEANYAMSLHPDECAFLDRDVECLNECWGWTGWKKRLHRAAER